MTNLGFLAIIKPPFVPLYTLIYKDVKRGGIIVPQNSFIENRILLKVFCEIPSDTFKERIAKRKAVWRDKLF